MFSLESQSKWLRPGNSPPSTLSAQWSRCGAQPRCEAQSSWTPRAPSVVLGLMDRAALMLKLHCPSKREEGSANNVGIPCSFTLLEEFSHRLFPVHVCKVTQSCLALCDPMDCSPPGSSIHGILQARILELLCPPPGKLPNPGTEPTSLNVSYVGQWVLYHSHHLGSALYSLFLSDFPDHHAPSAEHCVSSCNL